MRFITFVVGIVIITLFSATAEVRINEIMYDVNGADTGHEWIEIMNTGSSSVNLTSWKLYEQGINHNLNLITGSLTLSTGEFMIIADDAATFQQSYPGFSGTLFDSVFSLSNIGEYLALYNGSDFVSGVNYSSSWGGGNSYSLERWDEIWNTSLIKNGTPGKGNSIIPCISNIIITTSGWLNQTACQRNDTYIQNRTLFQYDANNCQQNLTLVEFQILDCDYCTPSWTAVNTSCASQDRIIQWYNDSNRCYGQTALASDINDTPTNITYSLVCDYDADGFIGNISNINSSLRLAWGKNATSIRFRDGNKTIVEFPILAGTNAFNNLFLERQSNGSSGYTIVRGWALPEDQTKTLHLDQLNSTSNAVCVKDAEVNSISEMSARCSGDNETIVLCNGELQSGYRCITGEGFTLSGAKHSAVQEFYIAPAVPAPAEPVPDESGSAGSSGGGGGGGGGNSCPPGKRVVQGKCVPVAQNSQPPTEAVITGNIPSENTLPGNRPPSIVVERDIDIDFSKAKPITKKPLLANLPFGNEITGAVPGVPVKSRKVIPLLVISVVIIVSCAAAWMVKGRGR